MHPHGGAPYEGCIVRTDSKRSERARIARRSKVIEFAFSCFRVFVFSCFRVFAFSSSRRPRWITVRARGRVGPVTVRSTRATAQWHPSPRRRKRRACTKGSAPRSRRHHRGLRSPSPPRQHQCPLRSRRMPNVPRYASSIRVFDTTPMAVNPISSGSPHVRCTPNGGALYVW